VPDAIINKPGPLDDEEWAIMKTHTVEGERMLQQVGGLLSSVGVVVRASHERWDGGGYPDGLAGEAIPVAALGTRDLPCWQLGIASPAPSRVEAKPEPVEQA
jgi:response regulator RpfG family c-di-GMP phosphodiesterase